MTRIPEFLRQEFFENEEAALALLERLAWPGSPACPHCGHVGAPYDLRRTRAGLRKCRACCMQFTVRVGTTLERSHIPVHKWLQSVFLIVAGKETMSTRRLLRVLDISYKSAWHLSSRIKAAERQAKTLQHN